MVFSELSRPRRTKRGSVLYGSDELERLELLYPRFASSRISQQSLQRRTSAGGGRRTRDTNAMASLLRTGAVRARDALMQRARVFGVRARTFAPKPSQSPNLGFVRTGKQSEIVFFGHPTPTSFTPDLRARSLTTHRPPPRVSSQRTGRQRQGHERRDRPRLRQRRGAQRAQGVSPCSRRANKRASTSRGSATTNGCPSRATAGCASWRFRNRQSPWRHAPCPSCQT